MTIMAPERDSMLPLKATATFGHAWVALTLALAAHVADEALTGFLSVYNPIVQTMRARYAWFPMPTFEFREWLIGLAVAVAVLLLMSPLAYRGSRMARIAAYPYAVLMVINGLGHLAGSMYFGYWMPGATTAPLLLAASVWLLTAVRQPQG
jgi:hypothetical protein